MGDLGRGDGTGLSPNAILLGYEWRAGAVSETWRTRYTETVEASEDGHPSLREEKEPVHPSVVFLFCFEETVSVRSSVVAAERSPGFSGNTLTDAL